MATRQAGFNFVRVIVLLSILHSLSCSDPHSRELYLMSFNAWYSSFVTAISQFYEHEGAQVPPTCIAGNPEINQKNAINLFDIAYEDGETIDCKLIQYGTQGELHKVDLKLIMEIPYLNASRALIFVEYPTANIPQMVNDEQINTLAEKILKDDTEAIFISIRTLNIEDDTQVATKVISISKLIAMAIGYTIVFGTNPSNIEVITAGLGGNLTSMAISYLREAILPCFDISLGGFIAINPVLREHQLLDVYGNGIPFYFQNGANIDINRQDVQTAVPYLFTKTIYSTIILDSDVFTDAYTNLYAQECDDVDPMMCYSSLISGANVTIASCVGSKSSTETIKGEKLLTEKGCIFIYLSKKHEGRKVVEKKKRKYEGEKIDVQKWKERTIN